jgi:DNA polymerase III delta subunit
VDGPDEALKAAFLAEFRLAWARHCPDAPHARVMRAGENGVDEVLGAFHGLSMFSTRELTMVLDVEDYARSEKRVAALAEGASRPAGESCLVFVESAAENERKSLAPLRAACAVQWSALPVDPRALIAWGERRLAAAGLSAGDGALAALLESCEGETLAFFNELGKLVTLAEADRHVTVATVQALVAPTLGADLPEYLAAVAAGRPGVAAQRLGRLLAEGVSEGQVLFALANLVGGALGGWARWRPLRAALARRTDGRGLARALDAVYRAESSWKGGRVDAVAALEQATREVATA